MFRIVSLTAAKRRIRDAKIGRQRDDAVQGEILLAVPEAPAFLEAPLMNITEA